MRGGELNLSGMGKKHCKDCTERYPGCHDYCERYLSEKEEWNKKKALRKKADEFYTYKIEQIRKDEKRRRKNGK